MVRESLRLNKLSTKSVEQFDAASVATNSDIESKQVDATAQENTERLTIANELNKSEGDSEILSSDNESEPSEVMKTGATFDDRKILSNGHQNMKKNL